MVLDNEHGEKRDVSLSDHLSEEAISNEHGTVPVEERAETLTEEAQRATLLTEVERLGGFEELGISPDVSLAELHDAVMQKLDEEAEQETIEREAAQDHNERAEAGRRLASFFAGLAQRGFYEGARRNEQEHMPEIDRAEGVIERNDFHERSGEQSEESEITSTAATGETVESDREDENYDEETIRQERAEELGLSHDASWDEISDAEHEEYWRSAREVLGLSQDVTGEEIGQIQRANLDRLCLQYNVDDPNNIPQAAEPVIMSRLLAAGIDPNEANKEQRAAAIFGLNPLTATRDEIFNEMLKYGIKG